MLTCFATCSMEKRLPTPDLHWDLLLTDANLATMEAGGNAYGAIENAALAINDGRIAWLGPMSGLPEIDAALLRSAPDRRPSGRVRFHSRSTASSSRASAVDSRPCSNATRVGSTPWRNSGGRSFAES